MNSPAGLLSGRCSHQLARPRTIARHGACFRHRQAGFLGRRISPALPVQRCSRQHGLTCTALFKFKNPLRQSGDDAGTYGSQKREDYSEDDVEQYFNYMGMLATEGTYDRLEEMLKTGTAPVDLLLLMAASENDDPKLAELIRAGANLDIKDKHGKTAKEIATSQAALELLNKPDLAYTF